MKLSIRKTKEDFKHHLQYSSWVYVLLIVLSFVVVSLVYAQTAYRPPQDKRIDVYIQSSIATQEAVDAFFKPIWEEAVPEMEVVDSVMLMASGGENDYYAGMQLMTFIAAAEGDIYFLSSSDFKAYASQGAFVDLGPAIEQGILDTQGLDLTAGKVVEVESNPDGSVRTVGEAKQYGIPAKELYRFATDLQIDNRDMVLAVAVNSQNEEPTIRFLNGLIQHTRAEMPDFFE